MSAESIEVVESSVENQQQFDGSVFPLVLICRTNSPDLQLVENWIRDSRAMLDRQAAVNGAILFRGFPLSTDRDFDTGTND